MTQGGGLPVLEEGIPSHPGSPTRVTQTVIVDSKEKDTARENIANMLANRVAASRRISLTPKPTMEQVGAVVERRASKLSDAEARKSVVEAVAPVVVTEELIGEVQRPQMLEQPIITQTATAASAAAE